jgi:MFS transporter, ACS family, D-galactonate transporter
MAAVPTLRARATQVPSWLAVALGLLSVSIFINYIDRGNLSTASSIIKGELHLDTTQLGFLLTAFFITYAPMQLVIGALVDRYDAGKILVAGFAVWSLATVLTGFAHGFTALLLVRLLLGLGESVAFPSYAKILASNFSEAKRGMTNACITCGMAAGPAFGIFVGGMLIATYGWRAFFIGFGIATALWIVPWLLFAQPHLSVARTAIDLKAIPSVLRMLRERSLWGAGLGHFGINYAYYFVLTWIPYYLVHERHWSLQQMAMIGGTAYLVMAGSTLLCGWLSDRWIAAGETPTRVRKAFLGVGTLLIAGFLMGCASENPTISAMYLVLACASFGLTAPNLYACAQTLAGPPAAGRWIGVQNTFGNIAGIIGPVLAGILAQRFGNFWWAFALAAGLSIVGGAGWVFVVGPIVQIRWFPQASQER